jgi:hypothetical protein
MAIFQTVSAYNPMNRKIMEIKQAVTLLKDYSIPMDTSHLQYSRQ